jgi:ubiquitin C-terminal hydrolase
MQQTRHAHDPEVQLQTSDVDLENRKPLRASALSMDSQHHKFLSRLERFLDGLEERSKQLSIPSPIGGTESAALSNPSTLPLGILSHNEWRQLVVACVRIVQNSFSPCDMALDRVRRRACG